jgi:hypothetical protein
MMDKGHKPSNPKTQKHAYEIVIPSLSYQTGLIFFSSPWHMLDS